MFFAETDFYGQITCTYAQKNNIIQIKVIKLLYRAHSGIIQVYNDNYKYITVNVLIYLIFCISLYFEK